MSTVKQFTVGTMLINAAMPSALEQDEALSLIGSEVVQRVLVGNNAGIPTNNDTIRIMFACMPTHIKQRVSTILLGKCVMNGTGTPVTINDFQGHMVNYNELLAQLTLWNYADFFTSLSAAALSLNAPGQPETAS